MGREAVQSMNGDSNNSAVSHGSGVISPRMWDLIKDSPGGKHPG